MGSFSFGYLLLTEAGELQNAKENTQRSPQKALILGQKPQFMSQNPWE